jgi:glycerol-3-phosphate dehydrogenase
MIRDIEKLTKGRFDLLIIGGGIHGAALAWIASLAGIHTALIEKQDFSQGASSNSQKIIHGGLRYLQQLDFPRINQSVNERKRLMWLAPHLVHPLECVMPIYGYGVKGKEAMMAGLKFYDFLSKGRNELPDNSKHIPNSRILSKNEINQYIPNLDQDGLRGGAIWYDGYCYNTERLVLSFIKSASNYGAVVTNYVSAINLILSYKAITGVTAVDEISHDKLDIHAKIIVNCTGRSINHGEDLPMKVQKKVAGLNVIVRKLFPTNSAIGLQSRSRGTSRFYFVLPWRGKSILGTEWFPFNGNTNELRINEKHCAQLIERFNKTYLPAKLKIEDIAFIHKGLVPGEGSSPDDISILKDYKIIDFKDHGIQGLYHVFGIKYTTAVFVAEQVMRKIFPSFEPKTLFDQPRLMGGEIDNFTDYKNAMIKEWEKQFDRTQIEGLVLNYGTQAANFLEQSIDGINENKKWEAKNLTTQEVLNAVREEMAIKLSDVILRRTDIGSVGEPAKTDIEYLSKLMARQLNWSEEQRCREMGDLNNFYPKFDKH